jgi:hypothetical protein
MEDKKVSPVIVVSVKIVVSLNNRPLNRNVLTDMITSVSPRYYGSVGRKPFGALSKRLSGQNNKRERRRKKNDGINQQLT